MLPLPLGGEMHKYLPLTCRVLHVSYTPLAKGPGGTGPAQGADEHEYKGAGKDKGAGGAAGKYTDYHGVVATEVRESMPCWATIWGDPATHGLYCGCLTLIWVWFVCLPGACVMVRTLWKAAQLHPTHPCRPLVAFLTALQVSPLMEMSLDTWIQELVEELYGPECGSYKEHLAHLDAYRQLPGLKADLLTEVMRVCTHLLDIAMAMDCAGVIHRDLKVRVGLGLVLWR